jgi:hypothetical protein
VDEIMLLSNCSVAPLVTIPPVAAARESAPVLTTARTTTCIEANEGRIF